MRALMIIAALASLGVGAAHAQAVSNYRIVDRGEALQTERFLRIEGRKEGVPAGFVTTSENGNMPTNFRTEEVYAYGPWQVCDGWRFSGQCVVIEGKYLRTQAFGLTRIGSARPVARQ